MSKVAPIDQKQIESARQWAIQQAAALASRPEAMEEAISRHERDLPEADAVLEMASEAVRQRGWDRLHFDEATYGHAMPWRKTSPAFRMRPAETTIWAGPNGSMKSAAVNFVLAHLAWYGTPVFLASLELRVEVQIARLARQMCVGVPTRERYDALMDRLGKNVWLYDYVGNVRPERAVALVRYAAEELGCQHVLLDNLTLIVPPGKTADEQAARFIAGLHQAGRETNCHVHLVAHVRKPSDPQQQLTRYDIRGTGAAPDLVDNVIVVQRNEAKANGTAGGRGSPDEPDLTMLVDKQRNGSWRGRFSFWIDQPSMRLLADSQDIPNKYV